MDWRFLQSKLHSEKIKFFDIRFIEPLRTIAKELFKKSV